MITTGMSNVSCLICDVAIDETSCTNIYTSLLRNGESLKNFALSLLRPVLIEFQSPYICFQCHRLFKMLEHAQYTVTNIRYEILKLYRRSKREKVIKQTSQGREYFSLANNHDEQSKEVTDDSANQIKSTVILKPTSDGIGNVSQIPWQNTVSSRDLSILDANTIADINSTKVIKSTSAKKKEFVCSNKEYISYAALENTKSANSNCSVINSVNIDISDNPLDDPAVLKGDCNTNDNNTVRQRRVSYTQRCEYCIELFKSYNELHIHMMKHENPGEYQDIENGTKFPGISVDRANNFIDRVAKAIIEDSNLPQDNQERDPLEMYKIDAIEAEGDAESVPGNKDCSSINANNQVEGNSSSILRKSDKALRHGSKSLEYSCSTCGKKWRTPAELRAHTKTHSTLRPYMCEKCGKAYKHKHALEVHVGMHNGINPFQCNYCEKCFTQKGALMRHLPMHTGEMPYQCELCGKRFVHHTSYNMHALSHTGKKSYQCNICDMFLLSTSHLKRHMRVHTGEKPYSCSLCGKRFAERYNLYAHRKIHDPVEITIKEKRKFRKKCEQRDPISDKKQNLDIRLKRKNSSDTNEVKKFMNCIFEDTAKGPDYALSIQDVNTKETNSRDDTNGQTWIQSASAKLHIIENQTKLVLENCLPQIDTSSLVTFNDQNFSMQDVNCDINPQISVTLNASDPNHIIIEKMNT